MENLYSFLIALVILIVIFIIIGKAPISDAWLKWLLYAIFGVFFIIWAVMRYHL